MFTDAAHLISSFNMTTILKLNISRKFQMLQLLFFSTLSDYKKNHLNIKFFDIKLKYKNYSYVQMKKTINLNVQEKTFIYYTQKKKFLTQINNKQYYKIFKMLNKHSNVFYST